MLRFLSVVWRIIDATKTDPSLYDLQAPYLNSMAGTSLDGKGVADTVAILHPFTTFDDNKQYYDDKKSTTYYANIWNAMIKNFEEHSILPAGKVTADDVVWGGPIWQQMVDYRTKTDEIMKKLAGATLRQTSRSSSRRPRPSTPTMTSSTPTGSLWRLRADGADAMNGRAEAVATAPRHGERSVLASR